MRRRISPVGRLLFLLLGLSLAANVALVAWPGSIKMAGRLYERLGFESPFLRLSEALDHERAESRLIERKLLEAERNLASQRRLSRALHVVARRQQDEAEEAMAEAAAVAARLGIIQSEARRLRTRNARLSNNVAALERDRTDSRRRMRAFADRAGSRIEKNIAKKGGGLVLKSLPFVGAGAVVAMTADELMEDCWLLNQVGELEAELGAPPREEAWVDRTCRAAQEKASGEWLPDWLNDLWYG